MNTKFGEKIGFIGLGKLGMPCAEAIAKKGFDVAGYDTVKKSSNLIEIKNSIQEVCRDRDIVFIATPTPHEEGYDGRNPTSHLPPKDFDYNSLKEVLTECNSFMDEKQSLVLISTVLPGTIRRELSPLVDKVKLLYNPYLIAMGTVGWDMLNPEMIMIGTKKGKYETATKAQQLESFYKQVCDKMPRIEFGTWEEIESIKIFYNTFISNKIALVNMIQDVANRLGNIDVDRVTSALAKSTQRIMSKAYMTAGMGDGGACHPRDNIALRWLAKELDLGYDIFATIMFARERQAENMAKEILKYGSNIHFTSDTYKSNTDLTEGSYSLLVQHYVIKNGGRIGHGLTKPIDVIVRVHESDNFSTDSTTVVFDPWGTYVSNDPDLKIVHYGKPSD